MMWPRKREVSQPMTDADASSGHGVKHQRTPDEMCREGGEGLPPQDELDTAWLFTCCRCGKRWADPIAPVVGCSCGSEQVAAHQFTKEAYHALRFEGAVTSDMEVTQ